MSVPTWYVLRSKRTGRAQVTAFCECLLQYDAYYVRSTISAIPEHPNPILYLLARPDGIVLYRKTIPPEALPATKKKKKNLLFIRASALACLCRLNPGGATSKKHCPVSLASSGYAASRTFGCPVPCLHESAIPSNGIFLQRLQRSFELGNQSVEKRKQASRPPARFFDLGRPKSPTESAARAEQKIKKIRSLVSPPSVIGQIYVPAWTALHQALRRCIPFHPFHSTARMPLGHRRIEARISFAALCARSSRATL